MELLKKLKSQGWHLTEEGVKKVTAAANSETDVKKIIATAMDMDFREIAGGALPSKREATIPGEMVLQLQKTRNISAPKSNEDSKVAPRFLQLELSDGVSMIHALEMENVPSLNMNIPPGTKIYFRTEKLQLMQGYIVLRTNELQVLGGNVEALVEKWELARTMQKYARSGRRMSGAAGPPPWIPFGKKVDTPLTNERNFKSLQAGSEKESKENEEFNAMRNEAIAEATKAGAKKVFGGGGQQILDHNVKKILEKGYSEEEAKQALKATNNNLERALYNLKRRQEYKRSDENSKTASMGTISTTKPSRGGPAREPMGKRGAATAKEEAAAAKPAANVSLFDFLTDKLPTSTEKESPVGKYNQSSENTHTANTASSNNHHNPFSSSSSTKIDKSKSDVGKSNYNNANKVVDASANSRPKFENNISSSFAANRASEPFRERPQRSERSERSDRDSYNNYNDRSSNARYSTRGGGAQSNSRMSGGSNFTSSGRNSNYNPNSRGGRGSHERSTGPSGGGGSGSGIGDRSGQQPENIFPNRQQQNRDRTERQNNDQRNRNKQNYDGNRQQGNNNNNNNAPSVATTANNSNNNNNDNNNMNKLVEATSKLKIDKNRREQSGGGGAGSGSGSGRHHSQQPQQQQQQPLQQQQQFSQSIVSQQFPSQQFVSSQQQQQQQPPPSSQNSFAQLPNGFTYDPSKIIGFQRKETNEFAMTLLKSQGLAAPANMPPQGAQHQPVVVPPQQAQSPPHILVPAAPAMQPTGHSPYGTPAPTYVLPNAAPLAPIPSHFGMIPGDSWMWKVGDLCLAKYWDDGRYYEAEITAVSDKTCVVYFLGYGNHEEVLKSDCLPITDVNHRPINNYNQQQPMTALAPPQPQAMPQPANAFQRGGGGGGGGGGSGGSQRYRGERQMYVPPHKRDN